MWLNIHHFARALSRNNRRTISRRPRAPTCRPRLEVLEDRCLLNAGSLDATFGNGAGYVTTSTSAGTDGARSVLIQPNGDIVAVGNANTSGSRGTWEFSVERYNPDGSLDTSFGSGGIAQASFGSAGAMGDNAALYPAGTANAGDIVEEGAYNLGAYNHQYQALARFNPNGTLDTAFGTGGEVITAIPGMSNLNYAQPYPGVVVTSSGQIVALSFYGFTDQFALARYNANGSLDTTFGQGGYVITSVSGEGPNNAGLLEQPNGDLIVYEGQGGGTADSVWGLYRFTPNGTLDTSFGNQGVVTATSPGGPSNSLAGALYPIAGTPNDGQIVLVGHVSNGVELARFNSNGSLDTTFGNEGFEQTQMNMEVNNAALDADSRIVVTGGGLARFNVNGTPDTTFGDGGLVTNTASTPTTANSVAIYPNVGAATDGDIILGGTISNGTKIDVLVARYLGEATSPYFQITGPSSVTAGTAGTYTISVYNPDGSADTSYSGTVHITSSDPKAVLPADFTINGDTATFSATLETAGLQSLTATDTVTSGISGGDASITITPAAASQFILSAPSSVKSGSKFSVTLTVEDAFGNVVTGYVGTVHFASSDSSATLPVNYTFTAADAGVHTFTSKLILRKRGTQTLSVTDTQNSGLTGTDSINVT